MVKGRVTDERRTDSGWSLAPPGRHLFPPAVALAVATVFAADLSFESPELRVAIETCAAVIAVLAAYLMVGRYLLSRDLRDLALLGALTALALGNAGFSTGPVLLGNGTNAFEIWAPVGACVVAALAFCTAAFIPDVRVGSPGRAAAAMLGGTVLVLGGGGLIIATAGAGLPTDFGGGASGSESPFDAPAGFLVSQIVSALLFAAAAVGFTVRALRTRDELIAWFAAGSVLAALSRVPYVLYPRVDVEIVATGDVLGLAFYLFLLAGALREIRRYQRRVAVAAVLDERRRLARDLHDGLAQELAYVVMQSRHMARATGDDRASRVAKAAENALGESRRAIVALTRRQEEPFGEAVAHVAGQVTSRAGARLRLEIDSAIDLESNRRDQLLNIVREAVSNGVRHGEAGEVSVSLVNGDMVRLTITDDGSGFDIDSPTEGFGLTSMRERAQALGGSLAVRSRLGEGTSVLVELP